MEEQKKNHSKHEVIVQHFVSKNCNQSISWQYEMTMTFSNTSLWTQTFRVISIYLSYIWILLCFNKAPIQAKKICVSVSWPTLILCADPNTFYYKSGLPTVIGLTSTVFTKQSYKNKCMQRYQKNPTTYQSI